MNRIWGSAPVKPELPSSCVEVYLSERPETKITSSTFSIREVPLPDIETIPNDKSIVRMLYVSVEPAMRSWLSTRKSYVEPVQLNATMRSLSIGVVAYSKKFPINSLVYGPFGWTSYGIIDNSKIKPMPANLPKGISATSVMGALGTTGMTAYFGLLKVGKIKRNQVVVVSAAAGATGSIAAQIAKHVYNCYVVGIAGGVSKCDYLLNELKLDAVVDYKSEAGVNAGLKNALNGRKIDIYFDNVGGETLEAALRKLNMGAKVIICGGISQYNDKIPPPGPRNYLALIVSRACMCGFLLYDYETDFPTAFNHLSKWMRQGKIKAREDEVVGLENAPEALKMLFEGKNIGKVIVRVSNDAEQLTGRIQTIAAKL